MDSINTSECSTVACSRSDVINGSGVEKMTNFGTEVFCPSLATFVICVMGLPGNIVVIGVYFHSMATSTRVYMFGLAVADLLSCVCGIILTSAPINYITVQVVIFISDISISVSCLLLAFVSVERLFAVIRPHKFSTNARRAKKALMVIIIATVAVKTPLTLAFLLNYKLWHGIAALVFIFTCILIMTVCYFLMAITLLRKARAARVTVGIQDNLPERGPSTLTNRTAEATSGSPNATAVPYSNNATVTQVNVYKDVGLLFTITFVFVVCWIPTWLSYFKVTLSRDITHIFMLNSLLNPFIYSIVSAMFRNDVRLFYHKSRAKLSACYH